MRWNWISLFQLISVILLLVPDLIYACYVLYDYLCRKREKFRVLFHGPIFGMGIGKRSIAFGILDCMDDIFSGHGRKALERT